MIRAYRSGTLVPVLCLVLSACGSGLSDQLQANDKSPTTKPELTIGDHPLTAADCGKLLDPGLRAACQSCATNPNAFQGCTTAGNVFDPLSCNCLSTAPGNSKKCGGVFCPAGGECCTTGTAPFAVQFCELPGSTLPPLLQQHSTCSPVCPSDRPTACGDDTCHNLLTDNANCGTCGNACTGTNVTCGGGGTPGVCGCTPLTAAVACGASNCGTAPNGCGGTVDCGTCTGTGETCGGGGTAGVCGCTAEPTATTCNGKCGQQVNNCGQTVDCGSCGLDSCNIVNGIRWCANESLVGQGCTAVCASFGFPMTIDDATWFNAQNTTDKCTAIANAFGLPDINLNSYTYACAEHSSTYSPTTLFCSTYSGCPTFHRDISDATFTAVCPCQ